MTRSEPIMKVESLYIYPIKSFRGISLSSTTLTRFGPFYDRIFTVLRIARDESTGAIKQENMTVASYNEMVRFFPSIDSEQKNIHITFIPVGVDDDDVDGHKTIDVPLHPDTAELEEVEVTMHQSSTKAFRMPAHINEWMSACFGFECILVYIGEHAREVLMSSTNYQQYLTSQPVDAGWSLSSLTAKANSLVFGAAPAETSAIKFSDCAPYLVVSSKSMDDVHSRLPEGEDFDISKFRPNIIVSGAREAWEEDFWAELTLCVPGDSAGTDNTSSEGVKLECEQNCARCRSINIDYATGAQGTGEAGTMLKKLSKDRRVDPGSKWSPVFGRYAFLHPQSEGKSVHVGMEVAVSRRNGERTAFDWKGLNTLPGGTRH